MGVVYTGRYRYVSGVKNFATIPVTVPPVQANETTWLDYPLVADSQMCGSAVTNNRMAVVTTALTTGNSRGVKIFVYGLDNLSMPKTLIAEVPTSVGVVRANVSFSPNGRYLMITSVYERTDLNPTQIDVYEVFDDRVEYKRSIDNRTESTGFYWFGDSDHFLHTFDGASSNNDLGSRQRLYVGSMTNPLLKVQVGTNNAYRFLCQIEGTNDFVFEDFITTPGEDSFRRVLATLNYATGAVTILNPKLSGPIDQSANLQLREFRSIGEGYISKVFQKTTAEGSGLGNDLYAYVGGTFVRIAEMPAGFAETRLEDSLKLTASGDLVCTAVSTYFKLGYVRMASIGGASVTTFSDVSLEGSSPGTIKGVHYNATMNRIVVVEDSGVRSYVLGSGGFKLPKAPDEPRFFFDLNANTAPTKALYTLPAQVKTGNPAVKLINGIPCMEFDAGASVAQPWLNLLDFGIERGYVHFWFRWETLRASQNFFSFGPYVGRSSSDYSGTGANPNAGVTIAGALGFVQRYKWNHILIAWDRGNVGVYFNGQREGYSTNAVKRPVRDFNNKQFMLGNPTSSNLVQFRDLTIHSGDTMGLMNNIEPAFLPPKWAEYRNTAWPSLADGAMALGQTPVITPKFS